FHAAAKPAPARPVAQEPRIGVGAIAGTAIFTALLVFVFMRGRGATPTPVAAPQPQPAAAVEFLRRPTVVNNMSTSEAAPAVAAPAAPAVSGARNPIEAARNATVFIRTSWGLGSGFIVDAGCHVITNRHVVESDGKRVANEVFADPEMQRR